MSTIVKVAPPNSVILISDSNGGEVPESMNDGLISSTKSCIAVGCRSDADGETEIVVGAVSEVAPKYPPAYSGMLDLPSRELVVKSVLGQTILSASVNETRPVIRVWVNDLSEPDHIVIGVP